MHRVSVDQIVWAAGESAVIDGDEAHHALRVKRVRPGERIELMDGRGGIAEGEVVEGDLGAKSRELHVRVTGVRREQPARPRVEIWTAVPKGGRVDEMIDQLAQVGAAAWRPLDTARGVVDPREAKMERLGRIAVEASKQCGRAWRLEIGPKATMDEALRAAPGVRVVVADASGSPWSGAESSEHLRLLIGPEGGWTPEELAAARTANASISRFGPHVMRIETAAVAACAMLVSVAASA
ncbi:MAG TPA: RsmE family RNA methyltransferase [Phycisphaerales bacterium]|nr:RsmE family RNA methyltransferase [Phycisphaerales bacterium]